MRITGITIEVDSVVIKGSDFDALCALAAENERLKKRCWALAFLLYPSGEPREAVDGDFGLHPKTD